MNVKRIIKIKSLYDDTNTLNIQRDILRVLSKLDSHTLLNDNNELTYLFLLSDSSSKIDITYDTTSKDIYIFKNYWEHKYAPDCIKGVIKEIFNSYLNLHVDLVYLNSSSLKII